MTFIIRPIRKADLDAFEELANSSSLGITSLPKNRTLLEKKINSSIESFSKQVASPKNEQYLFVLENAEDGKIGGTCTIFADGASNDPLYFYALKKKEKITLLKAKVYSKAPSELAGLFLHKDFRHEGLGRLLSLSRLLFVAAFKERFQTSFFANIRGVIDENNVVPFWEGIGRHFFDVDYMTLLHLHENDSKFIQEIIPKYPIYLELLPKEVQEVVGKPHEKSEAALKMLNMQGFQFMNEIDLFDGGPRILAKTSQIQTVRKSVRARIVAVTDEEISEKHLLSNDKIDFRACVGGIIFKSKNEVIINGQAANALQIKNGETIRYV